MNRIARAGATVAVLALAVSSLTACNRDTAAAANGGAAGKTNAVMVMSTLNNPFFVTVANGAKAEAKTLGMHLSVLNANNSDQGSLDLTASAITQKPDVLIIDPVGAESGGSMVLAANDANIPVMGFDRAPSAGKLANFIGYNAIDAGKRAADSLAESIGKSGTVVEIQGILGTNVAQDRSKGFEQAIAAYPAIKVVATQAADFDRGKALNVMSDILQANPKIDGVYAANDEMAMGVIAALDAAGKAGKVKVVGNDAIGDALTAIEAGTMYSTHAESAYALGQEVMRMAAKVAKGQKVPADVKLNGKIVTKATHDEYCAYLVKLGDTKSCA